MTFNQQLSDIIKLLNCTAKELAEVSGITPVTLSRYASGKRTPSIDSSELDGLASGISQLAKNAYTVTPEREELRELCDHNAVKGILLSTIQTQPERNYVIDHFNTLVNALNINLNQLAKHVGYDSSFLYRIKNGQRKPGDIDAFIRNTCSYIVSNYNNADSLATLAKIIGCSASELTNKQTFITLLTGWISSDSEKVSPAPIDNFLSELDSFNLDEYIRTIHFDELKVPNLPFYIIHSKTYYQLDGMKEAELDFYKGTVLSKSSKPIFMFSDMPMEDMAEDVDFGKKWLFAIAMAIKKGLHLNVIHNLNRPFNELLLGLQSWIPLYMTGQISPYYFIGKPSSVFHQLTYVSGVCALDGQCIDGHHKDGKYTLYSSKTDITYYQKRAKDMLSKASSLMDIYFKEDEDKLKGFLESQKKEEGTYKSRIYSLPSHTINKDLLEKVLTRTNQLDLLDFLWDNINWHRELMDTLTSHSKLEEVVAVLTKEEFDHYTPTYLFDISDNNLELKYTYEEYLEHIALTESYAENNDNYILTTDDSAPFRNIQIRMKENDWVIISKRKSPEIHFVIHHPKLVNAIWNFMPLVNE
ncbi:MAG: helix-turn-helix transcriptional regulator [Lachnospiraceae bacterium]|nr:helix-turn-helix transcriptional regulator [Candidatus Merdinaster equi]